MPVRGCTVSTYVLPMPLSYDGPLALLCLLFAVCSLQSACEDSFLACAAVRAVSWWTLRINSVLILGSTSTMCLYRFVPQEGERRGGGHNSLILTPGMPFGRKSYMGVARGHSSSSSMLIAHTTAGCTYYTYLPCTRYICLGLLVGWTSRRQIACGIAIGIGTIDGDGLRCAMSCSVDLSAINISSPSLSKWSHREMHTTVCSKETFREQGKPNSRFPGSWHRCTI